MLLVNAKVGISRIDGLGLIAQEFIPKGTCIWKFHPGFDQIISEEFFMSLSAPAQHQIRHYAFFDEPRRVFVLSADDDRFTNHSDNPNSQEELDGGGGDIKAMSFVTYKQAKKSLAIIAAGVSTIFCSTSRPTNYERNSAPVFCSDWNSHANHIWRLLFEEGEPAGISCEPLDGNWIFDLRSYCFWMGLDYEAFKAGNDWRGLLDFDGSVDGIVRLSGVPRNSEPN